MSHERAQQDSGTFDNRANAARIVPMQYRHTQLCEADGDAGSNLPPHDEPRFIAHIHLQPMPQAKTNSADVTLKLEELKEKFSKLTSGKKRVALNHFETEYGKGTRSTFYRKLNGEVRVRPAELAFLMNNIENFHQQITNHA